MIEQPKENDWRGKEWSRREPSDIDEARKGELSGESESIEPAWRTKLPFLNKPAREVEAGAGIEPARKRLMRPLPSHLATPQLELARRLGAAPSRQSFGDLVAQAGARRKELVATFAEALECREISRDERFLLCARPFLDLRLASTRCSKVSLDFYESYPNRGINARGPTCSSRDVTTKSLFAIIRIPYIESTRSKLKNVNYDNPPRQSRGHSTRLFKQRHSSFLFQA